LVVIDHYSKFEFIFPLVKANGKTLSVVMNKIFCTFGSPEELVSDNGPQLVSTQFSKLLADWGIRHTLCTPFHPQSNACERMNRNIKQMLRCFVGNNHKTWPNHLDEFSFALNSSPCETTGATPASLFLGKELSGPGDRAVLNLELYIPNKEMLAKVEKRAKTMAEKNKEYYDNFRSEVEYTENQLVLLKHHPQSIKARNFSSKLAPLWKGPYKIIAKLSPLNYRLVHLNNNKDIRIAHVEQIKLYRV
jgi:hypothetical protein